MLTKKTYKDLETIPKLWGWEKIIRNSDGYCGKILKVVPGFQCSIHYHKNKTETFLVQEGLLVLELWYTRYKADPDCPSPSPPESLDDLYSHRLVIMWPGDSITIPPLVPHRFSSDSPTNPCVFYEFSSPDDPDDSYRLEPSGPKATYAGI